MVIVGVGVERWMMEIDVMKEVYVVDKVGVERNGKMQKKEKGKLTMKEIET